jgi:hypothetical protein
MGFAVTRLSESRDNEVVVDSAAHTAHRDQRQGVRDSAECPSPIHPPTLTSLSGSGTSVLPFLDRSPPPKKAVNGELPNGAPWARCVGAGAACYETRVAVAYVAHIYIERGSSHVLLPVIKRSG